MTNDSDAGNIGPVHVIGTGLIGTSIGLALRRAGVEVFLEDVDDRHLGMALERGAGAIADTTSMHPQIVVVAVPPRHAAEVLARSSERFPDATLTDVTSVKARILDDATALGIDGTRLIGGHPMAGREISGAIGARADLLDDRMWVLTPTKESSTEHLRRAHLLVVTCGAIAIEMTPNEHDRAVALVSHAPQLLSSLLAAQLTETRQDEVQIAGQGLRDMTRIAASDSLLWADILTVNAEVVADVLDGVVTDLVATVAALRGIAGGDPKGQTELLDILSAGVLGQSRIPGKHGAIAAKFSVIDVMVVDRPGELARLFEVAGEADVNLEDVRIDHVLGRPSGLVALSVRPEGEAALANALRERGFDVRV